MENKVVDRLIIAIALFLVISLCVICCLMLLPDQSTDGIILNTPVPEEVQAKKDLPLPGQIPPDAFETLQSPFKPSLESREISDFLLTPGFIIQEAISPDQLIVYPEE